MTLGVLTGQSTQPDNSLDCRHLTEALRSVYAGWQCAVLRSRHETFNALTWQRDYEEKPMDAATFVEQLGAANQTILDRLAPAETLVAESGGGFRHENLLKIPLKKEILVTKLSTRGPG